MKSEAHISRRPAVYLGNFKGLVRQLHSPRNPPQQVSDMSQVLIGQGSCLEQLSDALARSRCIDPFAST